MAVTLAVSIDSQRLDRSIEELSRIGQLSKGGVCRLAFSPEDIQARQLIRRWMEEAGMTVRIDAAGNIIGRYPGKREDLGALATGSHIDTVAAGGRYDGTLGVLAGIEVVRTLRERGITLDRPVEAIVFSDEENTVIGCKAMAGTADPDPEKYRRRDGTDIQTCLQRVGGDWSKLETARRTREEVAAFVELHVEQGGVLESEDIDIGVVKGIVGQYRWIVTVTGRANHAGTTPMAPRRDALVAASRVVLAVNDLAANTPGEQVATVGMMNVFPNATNTVPGKVELSIDLRDLDREHLAGLIDRLEREIAVIAGETRTEIDLKRTLEVLPTLACPEIQTAIERACEELGASHTRLPSRAGHDAGEIGRFTAMGMIFVPSRAGISHSEDEYTSPEQCALGANILLHTFLRLDNHPAF
ncbi:Zn-dependent hydrolase [Pannus brasiliensis CCIBt3594]|uniref:Zn-dependent hydrolase n=1 Tax=Pannus brasiliensis CCIBt3594 TaxID=1427578 RepID=A0AAW9QSP8_9CHRO